MLSNKRLVVLLTLATALSMVATSPALAEYLDIFISSETSRSDPSVDGEGYVTWPPEWTGITLPHIVNIPGKSSILLGLENLHIPEFYKLVTLEYDVEVANVAPGETRAGYPPAGPVTGPWDEVTHTFDDPRHVVKGKIDIQPSWEWVEIVNPNDAGFAINILTYTSNCVPEPGTLLLAICGSALVWRRKTLR